MSCIAVVNRDTPKKENKSSKSHMHHNPETADICWIVSFFSRPPPPPPPTDKLSLETCRISDKKKGAKCETEKLLACVSVCA